MIFRRIHYPLVHTIIIMPVTTINFSRSCNSYDEMNPLLQYNYRMLSPLSWEPLIKGGDICVMRTKRMSKEGLIY